MIGDVLFETMQKNYVTFCAIEIYSSTGPILNFQNFQSP